MVVGFTVLLLVTIIKVTETCTCLPSHPQTHYCTSDYVLLVKVNSSKIASHAHMDYRMIEVKINKAFKTSEKINFALKYGQIWTPKDGGLCGVHLKPNVKYLITGRVDAGKAFTTLCNYHEEWNKLTPKQRKGFKLLYKQGCECKVAFCPKRRFASKCSNNTNTCMWESGIRLDGDCEGQYSICMRQLNEHCQWNQSRAYRQCLKEQEKRKKERQRLEP